MKPFLFSILALIISPFRQQEKVDPKVNISPGQSLEETPNQRNNMRDRDFIALAFLASSRGQTVLEKRYLGNFVAQYINDQRPRNEDPDGFICAIEGVSISMEVLLQYFRDHEDQLDGPEYADLMHRLPMIVNGSWKQPIRE